MEDGMWLDGSPAYGGRWTEFPYREGGTLDPANDINTRFGFIWEPISMRHDLPRGARPSMGRRGNVAFVDGHVEYVTETYTRDKRHILPEE